ncbi:Kinesin-like protein, partial [Globisporangium splendens]
MVPEREWRGAGQNMDKRTARKVHSDDFKRTLRAIRDEFLRAYSQKRDNHAEEQQMGNDQIHVYVRKRPLLPHELEKNEFDVISSIGKREIVIHECKMRNGGKSVCMMYGQTGSGKTYTMGGLFQYTAEDLFTEAVGSVDFTVSVSAIEIVGSKCFDLINNRSKVLVCEDSEGNTNLLNASEVEADSANSLIQVLENVKDLRSTESTNINSQSSRSHLVCYINLRHPTRGGSGPGDLYGQLVLLDLTGSERNADSFYHDAARRKETIEINKSHLALKECIRAIGSEDSTGYVPYRASTLTRILKSCLWSHNSKASVIATISPLSVDTEHTLHTLLCAGQMLEDAPHISTETVDVKEEDEEGIAIVPVREWDNDRVKQWFSSLRKGAFDKYVTNIGGSVDGRMITRFTLMRFKQICNGNAVDAGHVLKALKDEMAEQDKALKARRGHIVARHNK